MKQREPKNCKKRIRNIKKDREYGRNYYYKTHPNHLSHREAQLREKNSNWHGNKITVSGGRQRAIRWFPTSKGFDHHHIDGNPLNNDPSNIRIETRREHMSEDGRLAKLIEINKSRKITPEEKYEHKRNCSINWHKKHPDYNRNWHLIHKLIQKCGEIKCQ